MAGRTWTPQEDQQLTDLWASDRTGEEVAALLAGRTPTAIQVRAKRLGLRHTKEQSRSILSKMTQGQRNGMSGKPGPRRGVTLTNEQRAHLREVALDGFLEGRRVPLRGQDNPAFGKPGTMLGKHLPPSARTTLSEKGRARWDAMTVLEQRSKVDQLRKGWSALGKERPSKIEVLVEGWLAASGVSFESQVVIDFYVVDFKVGQKIVECHGDYWHANPETYPDPARWHQAQRANVRRDKSKMTFLANRGYDVLVLWERDLHQNPARCREQLFGFLGVQ